MSELKKPEIQSLDLMEPNHWYESLTKTIRSLQAQAYNKACDDWQDYHNQEMDKVLEVLDNLVDLQNGSPLIQYRVAWEETMSKANKLLNSRP